MRAALLLWAAAACAQQHTHDVGAVVRALHPEPGWRVADIGAGHGDFTFPIAKLVGSAGRVYAVDIDEKTAIRALRERAEREHTENVEIIFSKPDDPMLPDGVLDAVLIVNAYHEIAPYEAMLGHVRAALKPGGRLLIVDNMPGRTRDQPREIQVKNHMIAPELVEAELRRAGFEIDWRKEDIDGNPAMDHTRWAIAAHRGDTPANR
jgi:ubiquinone/menaquinone biosynthesis C-methylase UbiE